jgi:hypothetical protein
MADILVTRRFWKKLLLIPFLLGPLEIILKVFVLTYGTPCIWCVSCGGKVGGAACLSLDDTPPPY